MTTLAAPPARQSPPDHAPRQEDRPDPPVRHRWRQAALAVVLFGLVLAIAGAAWGWWVETWPPIVRRATITLDSPAMAGKSLRVALVSDIHVGSHGMSAARLDRVVDQIMAEKPDAIVLAGDFVNGRHPGDRAIRLDLLERPLARLRAPLGVIGVLGNHDAETEPALINETLARAGVTMLENDAVRVGPLVMAGGDEYGEARRHFKVTMAKAHALAEANALAGNNALSENKALAGTGAPIVLVEHTPSMGRHLPPDVPVLLAGHTHCGQVNLPFLSSAKSLVDGRVLYDPAFRCGLIPWDGHTVIVTGGVGSGSFPLRIGTRPDFWMVTFRGA